MKKLLFPLFFFYSISLMAINIHGTQWAYSVDYMQQKHNNTEYIHIKTTHKIIFKDNGYYRETFSNDVKKKTTKINKGRYYIMDNNNVYLNVSGNNYIKYTIVNDSTMSNSKDMMIFLKK